MVLPTPRFCPSLNVWMKSKESERLPSSLGDLHLLNALPVCLGRSCAASGGMALLAGLCFNRKRRALKTGPGRTRRSPGWRAFIHPPSCGVEAAASPPMRVATQSCQRHCRANWSGLSKIFTPKHRPHAFGIFVSHGWGWNIFEASERRAC